MTIIYPKKSDFLKRTKKQNNQLLWTTLKSDLDTPVSTYLKLCNKKISNLVHSMTDNLDSASVSLPVQLGFKT